MKTNTESIDYIKEIKRLKKEKNAVIMAHYYQTDEIQDIADFIGDSLALAQKASQNTADIILLAGVYFMGETTKILCPDKKVLIPDVNAGCSLADSCKYDDFKKFIQQYPDHIVISYVNTTAEIKSLTDIVVTSSNAKHIINSLPADQKIIFGPDYNLGNYINSVTGRNMVLWNGACHVHSQFSPEKIIQLKQLNPEALVISHPECKSDVLLLSDFVGSTSALLNFAKNSSNKEFIVATESGILHQMKKYCSDKKFIPVSGIDSTCGCSDCEFMKLNTLEKIYLALKFEEPEVIVDSNLQKSALKSITKMLELSENM